MTGSHSTEPAFLFDLDGTLLDTVYEHVLAWFAALESARMPVSKWKLHRRIGMGGASLVNQVTREDHSRHSKVKIAVLEKKHDTRFKLLTPRVRPLPGSVDLLAFLTRRRIDWAIATTGGRTQTVRLLRKSKLPSAAIVVTGDDVEDTKPAPDVFVLAADRLGRAIEDCVVVGDSVWDMLAAAEAGLVRRYSRRRLQQIGIRRSGSVSSLCRSRRNAEPHRGFRHRWKIKKTSINRETPTLLRTPSSSWCAVQTGTLDPQSGYVCSLNGLALQRNVSLERR